MSVFHRVSGAIGVLTAILAVNSVAADELINGADYEEIAPIANLGDAKCQRLSTFCMDGNGSLLVCDEAKMLIKALTPAGEVKTTWRTPVKPACIHRSADGTVYVGGIGELARLESDGKVEKVAKAAEVGFPASKVSGIATDKDDLFVAFGSPGTLRSVSTLVRFARDLTQPTVIAQELRGCCQRLDLTAKDGTLYVAENARHRVVKYDRTGKLLGAWGERSRDGLEGFGSCCNPMNLAFGPDGSLYTAESGLGRIKRYTPDGKFASLVGYVGVARFSSAGGLAASCANIAIAVAKDEQRVYVLDYKENLIRVLARKSGVSLSTTSDQGGPR